MSPFHPYTDYDVDDSTLASLSALLAKDPVENLTVRFELFAGLDPVGTGFVPNIAERAQLLAGRVWEAASELGLPAPAIDGADEAFLEAHPYGYGWYFYRHFMDTTSVPLLMVKVT